MDTKEKFGVVIVLIIAVGILDSIFKMPQNSVSRMVELLISIGVGLILSAISGQIVEAFSGDSLKEIFVIVPIGPFNFSLSLFVIVTFIVKIWIFK